jgi:hypothetical protein
MYAWKLSPEWLGSLWLKASATLEGNNFCTPGQFCENLKTAESFSEIKGALCAEIPLPEVLSGKNLNMVGTW